jgi:D-alanyl-D-alanine dipeptidase
MKAVISPRRRRAALGAIVLGLPLVLGLLTARATEPALSERPSDIVELSAIAPKIVQDMRYFTANNFIGRPIPGYRAPKCLLTRAAAEALKGVQAELEPLGYGLRVFDCYRPQQAVDAFVAWAEDLDDERMKARFYPGVEKAQLFRDGYIAAKSGHSRGSTLDLTIQGRSADDAPVPFDPDAPLISCEAPVEERAPDGGVDMGTGFDCFSPLSHTLNPAIGGAARPYRLLLKTLMDHHGFENLAEEWWHFTLRDEPYPDRYFDFPVD